MTLTELAVACRTYRRFTQEEVPQELLAMMVENARISNSAMNMQPLRYTVVRDPELVAGMQPLVHWAAKLPKEIGTPKEGEQPTAFIVIATEGRETPYTNIDVGIAVRTMTLTACEGGVGSCIMGNVNVKKVQELLDMPESWTPKLVLALGYPDHASVVVDLPENGDTSYYVNEDRDYFVPKRSQEDIILWR